MDSAAAFAAIADHFERTGNGRSRTVNYRLRDWGVSRGNAIGARRYRSSTATTAMRCAVPEEDLPVLLPEDVTVTGTGSPLKDMPEFVNVACPECGKPARRETDTFDTFVESSWYFARYACPDADDAMLDERAQPTGPRSISTPAVSSTRSCICCTARFFQRVMRDEGLTDVSEPFTNLLTQGMVLKDGAKMSKNKGNTVDPQALIDQFGADTVRLFMMFAAPPEQSLEWSDDGVQGSFRFLKRFWHAVVEHIEAGAVADIAAAAIERRRAGTAAQDAPDNRQDQ